MTDVVSLRDGGNMEPMPYECEYETSYYPWSQAETVFSWQFETEAVKNLFSTSGDIRIYQEFGLSDISGSFSPADYTDDGIRGLALEIDITSSGGSLAVVVLTGGSTGNTVWAGKEEAIIFDW